MAKRIAMLSEHASPLALRGSVDAGGQNVYVDEISRHLGALGYEVDIFTRRDAPDLPLVVDWAPGVRVINVPAGPAQWVFKDDLWPLMPRFRDEILHTIRQEGWDYDLIHSNFWMSGWVAIELKRRLDIPVVQIFHATGRTKQRHQGPADTSPAERIAVERLVVREANRIIAQCPAEYDELVADYGAAPERVRIVPSAVNSELYSPVRQDAARAELGLASDDLVVTYVGRMLPRKDIRNVVRAVALVLQRTNLPVKVLLVGGETAEPDPIATPEIGVLMALGEELGIANRLIFTGRRQPAALRTYYSAGDVAVTTPWYEPFGLTPLEAMACARPVIGSAVGGITFTIEDGVTGYLVPARDPAALASRLETLLRDPDLRQRMGRAGRQRVERMFTWATVAERTAALYAALLPVTVGV